MEQDDKRDKFDDDEECAIKEDSESLGMKASDSNSILSKLEQNTGSDSIGSVPWLDNKHSSSESNLTSKLEIDVRSSLGRNSGIILKHGTVIEPQSKLPLRSEWMKSRL